MNNFVRITAMFITFIFGGLNSAAYIASEVIHIAGRESMDGYFNLIGMISVVLAFILILTQIQSIICQIKIMILQKKRKTTNSIDEDYVQLERESVKFLPSKFLRNSNMIYTLTIVLNFAYFSVLNLIDDVMVLPVFIALMVTCLLVLACGVVLSIDTFRLRKRAIELIETHELATE